MSQPARRFAEWTETLSSDVWSVWSLMTNDKIAQQGRRLLAGALGYILTHLDLIPDHERAGAIDDGFVLRLACALASEHAAEASVGDSAKLGRLANDEDEIKAAFDEAVFAKLRRYVVGLADKEVRGRSTERILSDEKARNDFKRELEAALKRIKPVVIADDKDAEQLLLTVKSYLSIKLK
jgi:uncharacterized membrane protein YkvA (DUF1232 family)